MKKIIPIILLIIINNILFSQTKNNKIDSTVFSVVEDMPIFKKKCLKSNDDKCSINEVFDYIKKASYTTKKKNGTKKRVYLSFIVEKDGTVSTVILKRGVDDVLDKIAIKYIENMPKFYKPGYQRGKPIRLQYMIPFDFYVK